MEIACVAEGVETRAQLDTLRRLGCDFIQGYYFAKPMHGDAIDEYLAKERQRLGGAVSRVVA
jgi:EAL domain-containing protein (putative c-di-GMP-specific phosphodiesterase class I)